MRRTPRPFHWVIEHVIYCLFFSLLTKLKEMQSEKLSITLRPGENSEFKELKDGKHSLSLLAESTKWPLTRDYCLLVRESRATTLRPELELSRELISDWIRWLRGNLQVHSWDLPPSFWRWRLMGINPTMALILNKGDVLKAPNIYIAALLCIFPSAFKW